MTREPAFFFIQYLPNVGKKLKREVEHGMSLVQFSQTSRIQDNFPVKCSSIIKCKYLKFHRV